jgi:hypothetical protein
MNLRLPAWLILGLCCGVIAAAAGEAPARVDDPAPMLPPGGAEKMASRLEEFEHRSGIRLLVQFHANSPAAEVDKVPGAYMSALAEKLGTRRRGVLVVYFADDPDWRIWIGDDLAARFAGRAGTVQELTASEAIHNVKQALLDAAHAQAEATFAALRKSAPPASPPTPARHLQLQADALLDALMAKFSAK